MVTSDAWTPTVVGLCLADVEAERIAWRSRGRLAKGKLTVVDGDPGLGKSTMLMDWAARVTLGLALPDGERDRPRGVVLMSAEDDPADTIRPRLDAISADLSKMFLLSEIPGAEGPRLPMLPEDVPLIESYLVATDAALLIIDPLMAYFPDTVNSNRDQDVRRALAPLAQAAQRTGVSVVLVRHLNKAGSANALYRGGGSIGIIGAARFGLLVAQDPDDPSKRVLASVKCNLARAPDPLSWCLVPVEGTDVAMVDWLGTSQHTAVSLLSSAADDEGRAEHDECRDWLEGQLLEGATASGDIQRDAKKAGFSERSLKRAKAALRVRARREGFGKEGRWLWELPNDHEPPPEGGPSMNGIRPSMDIGERLGAIEGHRLQRGTGVSANGGRAIFYCVGCGTPRGIDSSPCPACGETKGEYR